MKINILTLLLSFFLWTISAQTPPQYDAAFLAKIDSLRTKYHIQGAVFARIEPNNITFGKSGIRRMGYADSVQLTDLFHLGSNSKTINAFLAAELVEQGKLSWDFIPKKN